MSTYSDSFFDVEICNANAHHVFNHDNFPEGNEGTTHQDVDILASGPCKFQDTPLFQVKYLLQRHDLSVQFDGEIHDDVSKVI